MDLVVWFLAGTLLFGGCKTDSPDDHSLQSYEVDSRPELPTIEVALESPFVSIKLCSAPTLMAVNLHGRSSCPQGEAVYEKKVTKKLLVRHLKIALNISNEFVGSSLEPKVAMYKRKLDQDAGRLNQDLHVFKTQMQDLSDPYLKVNSTVPEEKIEEISGLTSKIKVIEDKIYEMQEISKAKEELNQLIDTFAENLAPRIPRTLDPKDQTEEFIYLLLLSYLKAPAFSANYVRIPASNGDFVMGKANSDGSDEQARFITLTKGFEIGETEVTQLEWFVHTDHNPSYFQLKAHCPEDHLVVDHHQICPRLPVESVSWFQVKGFLDSLNQSGSGQYRLPTEAEWEYAARSGKYSKFNRGDELRPDMDNFNSSVAKTIAVGSLENRNQFGVYDIHGNVAEWTGDKYDLYDHRDNRDPTGPSHGDQHVYRGCAWNSPESDCRLSARFKMDPKRSAKSIGFRVVRTVK
jgi:formylglycine-generating enzyme required for sulfatase activity